MKLSLLFLFLCSTLVSLGQKTTTKEAWLEKWENSKNYLIEIAEAMPEAHYDFKPTERQMSFKEQLVHIKSNMDWLSNTYFSDVEFKREKLELPETKAEIIALITEGFDKASLLIAVTPEKDLLETVDFFAGPKSKLQIINLLHDHVTHHRGQLIVYLNLNNIKPPNYVGW